jgi:hypothetical protein
MTNEKFEWQQYAIDNKYSYLLVIKDLESKDYFPVYFNYPQEVSKYKNNIISESKIKVVEVIFLYDLISPT